MSLLKNLARRNTSVLSGRGLFAGSIIERKGETAAGPQPPQGLLRHPENLSRFEQIYRSSAVVNAAINNLVDLIVGIGYYTEAKSQDAKSIVDTYAEEANMDCLLRVICRNMLIFGFAPVERWWNNTLQLKPLPPQTVYAQIDEKGNVTGYKQRTWSGRYIEFTQNEVIWFSHTQYPGNPYGVSLIEPIYQILEYKNLILNDMCRIIHRYASPLNIFISKVPAEDLRTAIISRSPDEDIFIGNASPNDVEIKTLEIDPRGRYTDYIAIINQEIYEALQAPLLAYLRNATEASARVQLEVIQRHVEGIQRYLKRTVEREIFKPLVEREGAKEIPRIRWGLPRSGVENITVRDIALLSQSYILTSGQAISLLRKMGIPIEENMPVSDAKERREPFSQRDEAGTCFNRKILEAEPNEPK